MICSPLFDIKSYRFKPTKLFIFPNPRSLYQHYHSICFSVDEKKNEKNKLKRKIIFEKNKKKKIKIKVKLKRFMRGDPSRFILMDKINSARDAVDYYENIFNLNKKKVIEWKRTATPVSWLNFMNI